MLCNAALFSAVEASERLLSGCSLSIVFGVGVAHRRMLLLQDSPEAFEKLEQSRVGVLVGTGMGGLKVLLHDTLWALHSQPLRQSLWRCTIFSCAAQSLLCAQKQCLIRGMLFH